MGAGRSESKRLTTSETLRRYLQEISRIPPLSPEEERRLARRACRGDREARKKLVEGNLRFVVSFAKKYRGCGLSFLDLINQGNLGLIEAAKRFDPGREVRFLTYAVWWIRQSILHALLESGNTIRLPQKQAHLVQRLDKIRGRLAGKLRRAPKVEELADEMELTTEEVEGLMQLDGEEVSLDAALTDEGDYSLGDRLPEERRPGAEEVVFRSTFEQQIREAIGELDEREQHVLKLRFGIDDAEAHTLKEIGKILGLSRERVRQIEGEALRKLQRSKKCLLLRGYLN